MFNRLQAFGCLMALTLAPMAARADDLHDLGRQLYMRYCSACHGENATGDGIVSGLMTPKPIDLTQLAKRHDGKFPFRTVMNSIDGRQTLRAHGDPDMPVWGEILTKEMPTALGAEGVARTKVAAISGYLESIQQK